MSKCVLRTVHFKHRFWSPGHVMYDASNLSFPVRSKAYSITNSPNYSGTFFLEINSKHINLQFHYPVRVPPWPIGAFLLDGDIFSFYRSQDQISYVGLNF